MKSHVSVLLEVMLRILMDASMKCTDVSLDERDMKTITSRVKHEGLSFLTITLPSFGRDFDRSLSDKAIDPTFFRAFRKNGRVPAFLQGFLDQVFDRVTGRILSEPSIECIEGVRQVTYAFKKLKIACTPNRVRKAIDKFAASEHCFQKPLAPDDLVKFDDITRVLWNPAFFGEDFLRHAVPKHGPGATAERLSGNRKYSAVRWHDRLEPYFPLLDYRFANADSRFSKEFQKITIVRSDEEQPVRVTPVPKTLKGPRIIAIEPVCMQYAQQALSEQLVKLLETYELTSGHVNFTDQEVNRTLAMISSSDGRYATIDLSSASDRVPYSVAIRMFQSHPDLMDAISACRSMRAELPNGEVIPLRKFASMGSALCFPIEAMYFYTLCVMALIEKRKLPVSFLSVKTVKNDIFIYGDDIIIPTDESDFVISILQKYYCKVNTAKSYWNGKFRESCGMDAFDGEEVTPLYVRQMPPDDKRSASKVLSWVALGNHFYRKGYWRTSQCVFEHVEEAVGSLPIVLDTSAGIGKHSFQNVVSLHRWGKRYQRPEVWTWVGSPVYQRDPIDGEGALLKTLLLLERQIDGLQDKRHLRRTARHGAVALKRRWVSPF